MANNDFTRFSKKVVQYFWDPLPRNDDPSPIWCLGRSYDSRYQEARASKEPGTSPSAQSSSGTSQADSAVVTDDAGQAEEHPETRTETLAKGQTGEMSRADEEALGWPPEFLDDLESRVWLTYRSNFHPIARSSDPAAGSGISFATKLRNLGNQGGFSSDTGWGCMIRSGQSLLAESLAVLELGRDWRLGTQEQEHKELLSLFADDPEAPFSIHKFVEHGAQACGTYPGEWFGPSATARCIQALTTTHSPTPLHVYVRPDDSDVYAPALLATATANHTQPFRPTLILLGVRLGIDHITPIYHAPLKHLLHLAQSVGIAGGRPSSSHYFLGHQGDAFFYLDPHYTRPALPLPRGAGAVLGDSDAATCHTRRVRRLAVGEVDPCMLLGFLVRDEADFEQWSRAVGEGGGKAIVHVHEGEGGVAVGGERAGAVDEVEVWDEESEEEGDGVFVEREGARGV